MIEPPELVTLEDPDMVAGLAGDLDVPAVESQPEEVGETALDKIFCCVGHPA